ncbi:MAG: LruC domain-containing protein [Bacteroidales bacterium]|nr:LruC domain-containing protein [Bacteroidales bacterium]MCF8456860.1 LruC domain-containing protein [Bacteroidales bacterium]
MKKFIPIAFLSLMISLFFSCRRDFDIEPVKDDVESFSSMVVSDDFEYKSSREIELNIKVLDEITSLIEIYNDNPDNGGFLLKKGLTGNDHTFRSTLVLPYTLGEIYIVRRSFDGTERIESIPVTSNNISFNFGYKNLKSEQTIGYLVNPGTWPDCSTAPDFDVTNSYSGDLDLDANETWRIATGVTYEGDLDFPSYGTNYVIVCGTATFTDVKSGVGTVVITSTGILTIETDFDPSFSSNIINFGTVTVKNGGSWKKIKLNGGSFENHGNLEAKTIQLDGSSTFLNTGSITLTEDLDVNTGQLTNDGSLILGGELILDGAQTVFENYDSILVDDNSSLYGTINNYNGTMHFDKELTINGGATFYNGCKLWVDNKLTIVGTLENAGYVLAESELEVNGGSTIYMEDGCLISVEDLDLNGHLSGSTYGFSKIMVSDNTDLTWGTSITGKIDLCDADGTIEVNHATIGSDVTYCVNEVMSTDCVPGAGITIADLDNDGVPDSMDEYPNDINRAFNSYYPNATDFSSLAFEDLWPTKGDYDFNDLIINLRYKTVTNANNLIVDLVGEYKIVAAGASFNNGFGFSLDVLPGNVASVVGTQILGTTVTQASNGLEAGHVNKAVVIVCDQINTYTGSGMLNTEPTGPTVDVPMITVTVTFATPQASIGTEPYNSFIFVNQVRGREVHLINQPPTELADPSWFGQGEDVSSVSNSEYYKTVENFPFGLETPVPLDYPTEKQDIVTAHLKFGNWAQSSGSQFPDWYDNKPGYRNNNKMKHNNGTSINN